jgi:hypothetical protein
MAVAGGWASRARWENTSREARQYFNGGSASYRAEPIAIVL